jgi:protein-S-isoprenylcysteine O-methyltransferase Ste14
LRSIRPLHLAYALIICFFIAERLLRRGASARSFEEGASDPGTTRAIGAAFGTSLVTLLIAPLLNHFRIGRFYGYKPAWGGVVLMLLGLLLRIWASLVLGAFYTRTLRTTSEQRLVMDGPYSLVRHPGYLGVITLWLGAAISSANGPAMALIAFPLLRAYKRRIEAEEAMLAGAFGQEYEAYAARTWKLIPLVY